MAWTPFLVSTSTSIVFGILSMSSRFGRFSRTSSAFGADTAVGVVICRGKLPHACRIVCIPYSFCNRSTMRKLLLKYFLHRGGWHKRRERGGHRHPLELPSMQPLKGCHRPGRRRLR